MVVGAAVLILVVTVGAFLVLRSGGEDTTVGWDGVERNLAAAVEDSPEEVWSWRPDSDFIGSFVVTDNGTLATWYDDDSEAPKVTSLDDEGNDRWETGLSVGTYLIPPIDPDTEVVFAVAEEAGGYQAIATDDGDILWEGNGYIHSLTANGPLVSDEGELRLLETSSGEEIWSVELPRDIYPTVSGDVVAYNDEEELVVLELGSGDERWRMDTGLDLDMEEYPTIAVNREMAVMTDGTEEVVAFSLDHGEELWRENAGPYGSSVGDLTSTLVYVEEAGDYDAGEGSTVRIFDREGERGEIDVEYDDYFDPRSFTSGGTEYFYEYASGLLYDEQLDVVGRYSGELVPVEGGFYQVHEGEVGYYELGDSAARWSKDIGSSEDWLTVVPADERLLVLDVAELISFE